MEGRIIPNRGDNYEKLLTYRKATVLYDITYFFCSHFVDKRDRTYDQMVQSARSGKQNIVEGCAASATSSETEIKLINVAKASFKELLEDYKDYLRRSGFRQWEDGSVEKEAMRKLGAKNSDTSFYRKLIATRPAETIANMAIVLLYQEDYLLHRQLQSLERAFKKNGGFREKMARVRREEQGKQRRQ
ncbi:MAG: four helix bundle suffix domain-containing protein [Bacteroidia bacterium]|nr:four helix bundle suffix domain-containing protein [Bacteroidia bacterium]